MSQTPAAAADGKKPEKSYLSSAVDTIKWAGGSRSATPTQPKPSGSSPADSLPPVGPGGGDHSTSHLYGRSASSYPPDCPPLKVLWFHATDVGGYVFFRLCWNRMLTCFPSGTETQTSVPESSTKASTAGSDATRRTEKVPCLFHRRLATHRGCLPEAA